MAELYRQENGTDVIVGTIAVDVSSHPARFPRYGFVADFDGVKTEEKTLEEDGLSEPPSHQLGTVSGLAQ